MISQHIESLTTDTHFGIGSDYGLVSTVWKMGVRDGQFGSDPYRSDDFIS
jgi:hypothetical protein